MPVLSSYWFLFEGNISKISQKPQESTYAYVSL